MLNRLIQPTGTSSDLSTVQTIARIYNEDESNVVYLAEDALVSPGNLIYDTVNQSLWAAGSATGKIINFSLNDDNTLQLATSGGNYVLNPYLRSQFNLLDFIPRRYHKTIRNSTEKTDLSLYVQRAIDTVSSSGGGALILPAGTIYCSVYARNFVVLLGTRGVTTRRSAAISNQAVTTNGSMLINSDVSKWVIDVTDPTQSVQVTAFGVIGVDFKANLTGSQGGLRIRGPETVVKSCLFSGFQQQGMDILGNINTVEDLLAVNCCMDRTGTTIRGTLQIDGADCQIHRLEGNAGIKGALASPNGSICGIYIKGNNHYVSGLMGEISEIGICIDSANAISKVSDCRADNNVAHGYQLNGVMAINCHSYNNSRAGDGLYDGFYLPDQATRIFLMNCYALCDNQPVDKAGQKGHRYGFNLAGSDFLSLRLKPWISQCFSYGHVTAWKNSPPGFGEQQALNLGRLSISTNLNPTPTVDGVNIIDVSTTSTVTITGFVGGEIGQEVDIYLNAQTTATLVNSATFLVNNYSKNADKVMVVGRVYKFVKTSATIWREVGDAPRQFTGTTAQRQNSFSYAGMPYFDLDLGLPIWRNKENTGWINATGTAV